MSWTEHHDSALFLHVHRTLDVSPSMTELVEIAPSVSLFDVVTETQGL